MKSLSPRSSLTEVKSYRDLPKNLYHIQWKFRDEVRPRFGVMRGREFYMKDAYSFDLDAEAGRVAYNKMFVAYLRTFARMGLKVIPMRAETGPIGGDMSHEFLILADTGESAVFCHKAYLDMDVPAEGVDYEDAVALAKVVAGWTAEYAMTDDMHDAAACPVPADDLVTARGIEVGHIFFFGTKYSAKLGAKVAGPGGEEVAVEMGSYGIGVSRLVGAIIEACHDDAGAIWPESVAPFQTGLVNLRQGDDACDAACEDIFARLRDAGREVLYDDRDERAGVKFADMDLIGLPWQLVVGPRGLKTAVVELKNRASGAREELSIDACALAQLDGTGRFVISAFERLVAFRYLRARRQEGFISVVAWFSLVGIMLGVATLIIVMSVMNGFRAELLSRILGVNGHVEVTRRQRRAAGLRRLRRQDRQDGRRGQRDADGRGPSDGDGEQMSPAARWWTG